MFCCCLHCTIFFIVPWCPAVYKTSTASIQSIGFTVTGIPFCLSELLISFACDFLGLIFDPGIFWVLTFGSIRSSPSLEIPSTPLGYQPVKKQESWYLYRSLNSKKERNLPVFHHIFCLQLLRTTSYNKLFLSINSYQRVMLQTHGTVVVAGFNIWLISYF